MKYPSFSLTAALAAMLFPANGQAALVSYLALDNATGLTLNNGAAITSGSLGKFGEAVSFDGSNDWAYVNAGNPVSGTGVRTVSTWVYQTTTTGLRTPVAFGNNIAGGKWEVDIDNDIGGIEVGISGGRTIDTGLAGQLTGSWSLIVTTLPVAGSNIQAVRTYFNGAVRTNTTAQTQAVNTVATNPLGTGFRLGTSVNNASGNTAPNIQFFGGLVDDVAVWNEALTAEEIKGLYDVGMSVPLSYTAGDFDLLKQRHDLGTGSTTIDGLEWTYATGLTDPAGLTTGPGGYTLVLANGTGLTAIPEPSAALFGGLGLLALLRRRNR